LLKKSEKPTFLKPYFHSRGFGPDHVVLMTTENSHWGDGGMAVCRQHLLLAVPVDSRTVLYTLCIQYIISSIF